jgi:hypothetical protein
MEGHGAGKNPSLAEETPEAGEQGSGGAGLEKKVSELQAELEHVKLSQAAEVQAIRTRAKQDNRMAEEARRRAEREVVEKSDQIWIQSALTCEELCSNGCSVQVTHPQDRSGGYIGAYISYRLTTAITKMVHSPLSEQEQSSESQAPTAPATKNQPMLKKTHVVNRRYNDFAWLREQLVKQFPASLVPCLPSRKAHTKLLHAAGGSWSAQAKKEFLEKRCRALNHFVDNIAAYSQYAQDAPFVLMFLSLDEAQWEATMSLYGRDAETEQQELQVQPSSSPPKPQWFGSSPPSDASSSWQSTVMGSVQTATGAAGSGLHKTLSAVMHSLGSQAGADGDWSAASGSLGGSGVVGKVSGAVGLVGSQGWRGDDSEELGLDGLTACCAKFREMRGRVRMLQQALQRTSQVHNMQASQLQTQRELASAIAQLEQYEAQYAIPEAQSSWFSSNELDLDEALAAAAAAAAETDLSLSGIQQRSTGESVANKVAAAVARGEAAVAAADSAAADLSKGVADSTGGNGGIGSEGSLDHFFEGEEGREKQEGEKEGRGRDACKKGPGAETSLAVLARFLAAAAAEPQLQRQQALAGSDAAGGAADRPGCGTLATYQLQCGLENENLVLKCIVDAESRLAGTGECSMGPGKIATIQYPMALLPPMSYLTVALSLLLLGFCIA